MGGTKIYIVQHKPYRTTREPGYLPLQVGAGESFCPLRDNTGDTIAEKNPSFCELTALYWIWKNDSSPVIGLVHYRRYFASNTWRGNAWDRILSCGQIDALMQRADILLPKKRHYIIETNYTQYAHAHHEKDLLLTRQVLSELHPEYAGAFDAVMKQRSGHRFNMLVAKRDVLDRYCRWLFPILFELEKRVDISGYDAYNRRVIGFLAERLLDVWLYREKISIVELPVVNIEGENWLRKGTRFCLRKLKGTFRR